MAKKTKTKSQTGYTYRWPRPMVTVDALVFKTGPKTRVLLIKRGKSPYKDFWAVPGGFVNMDEDLHIAAARELNEETGLSGIELSQLHTFGKPGRDPRGRNITICFIGIAPPNARAKGGDDAAQAKWFDINRLPKNLAFDHTNVISIGISRLNEILKK